MCVPASMAARLSAIRVEEMQARNLRLAKRGEKTFDRSGFMGEKRLSDSRVREKFENIERITRLYRFVGREYF